MAKSPACSCADLTLTGSPEHKDRVEEQLQELEEYFEEFGMFME